jgi:hypothetical protein
MCLRIRFRIVDPGAPNAGVAGPRCHHDYPHHLEEWFAGRGIDINEGSNSGRWLPEAFHKLVHGKGATGMNGDAWIWCWDFFKNGRPTASIAEIEAFRDGLRALTSNPAAASVDWTAIKAFIESVLP